MMMIEIGQWNHGGKGLEEFWNLTESENWRIYYRFKMLLRNHFMFIFNDIIDLYEKIQNLNWQIQINKRCPGNNANGKWKLIRNKITKRIAGKENIYEQLHATPC